MTQKFEIKNRWTGEVLFSYELQDGQEFGMIARHAIEAAISEGVYLRGVDLRGADLRGADLRGADLWDSDLRDTDLRGVDLRGVDLRGTNLRDADLRGADLRGADLRGAKNAPLVINGLHWVVTIDGLGNMRIGCQNHSVEDWKIFTDERISQMAGDALEFWNKHKTMLLGICDNYKHEEEK